MSNPTAQEQEFLELINRMRTAPVAELNLLLNSNDPAIKASIDGALAFFKTDLTTLKSQWTSLIEVAPLAWSDALNNSAAAHNQAMIVADTQSHQLPGEKSLGARVTDAGYVFTATAENIFTGVESPLQGEAALAIDWGMDDPSTPALEAIGGIQNPAGHRHILLDANLREVGISVIASSDPTKQNVGPFVLTEDFGTRTALNGKAYILGVAFDDKNVDGYYQAGEGLADVQIKITNVATKASQTLTVGAAGGYQQLVDPGDYEVEFSRGGTVVQTATTSISAKDPQNVKLDFVIPNVIVQTFGSPGTIGIPDGVPSNIDMVKKPINGSGNPNPNTPITVGFADNPPLFSPSILPVMHLGEYLQDGGKSEHHLFDFTKDFGKTTAPDLKSNKIDVNFLEVTAEASYHNYAGLYRIDDAAGTVDGFKPGDAGYMTAALKRSKEAGQDVEFDRQGLSGSKSLKGGYIYAPFVVADGTVDQVLNSKDPGKAPHVYFNYIAANGDGFDHIKSLGANKFAFEDTWGGGDRDYNDLIFKVEANVASVVV